MKDSKTKSHTLTNVSILVVLTALTLAVFAQVHSFEFVNFDDDVHVYRNAHVTGGLTIENSVWAFGIHGPSQWHPLAWLSHQLDCELFELWAGGHHLTNLFFHIGNVALLFLFLARVTDSFWRSAFVAAVFAVHPLNVESVAWVSERRNVLALFFGLLTVISYVSFVRARSVPRYLLMLCLFSLALMSKPLVVTLPFVLLLLDFWPLGQMPSRESGDSDSKTARSSPSFRRLLLEKLPLLLLSVGASVLTILCQDGVIASADALPLHLRILNALAVYPMYLVRVVCPTGLGVFYPHPGFVAENPASELLWPALVGGVFMILITAWALRSLRTHPALAVGWFWYLGTLVPMIGLVQSGQQQLADRYVYLPVIGILIAVTWVLPEIAVTRKLHRSWLRLASGVIMLACGVCSWVQTGYWRDSVALFEHTLSVTERNSWAHNNLGLALMNRGFSANAMPQFIAALEINPEYGLARYNFGIALHNLQETQSAVRQFQDAVRLMPQHVDSHMRLGIALANLGDFDGAVSAFGNSVRLSPGQLDTHLNLGIALSAQGNAQDACRSFRRVLELDPHNLKATYRLAAALFESGELDESEKHFREAIGINPRFAPAHNDLAKLLLAKGDRSNAIRHFREALRIQPNLQQARTNLERALTP
ncbi:MAG: tetratricopeptide repeat protein [Fuerstiella sp.]|nr:tetratricopeptide repeat protein [Fuerstiella sp.]